MAYVILIFLVYLHQISIVAAHEYMFYPEAGKMYKFHNQAANWGDAFSICLEEGGSLAHPKDSIEKNVLTKIAKINLHRKSKYILLGFHDKFLPGLFTVVNGDSLFKHFNRGKWTKHRTIGHDCGALKLKFGFLTDVPCYKPMPFICEKDNRLIKGYKCVNGTEFCYKFHTKKYIWGEAETVCQSEGGHLAVVENSKVEKILTKLIDESNIEKLDPDWDQLALVGFHQLFKDGVWVSIDGHAISSYGYFLGAENHQNGSVYKCGAMYKTGQIAAYLCSESNYFICQRHNSTKTL